MAPNLPITHIIGAWFKHRNWCCYVVFKSYYIKQWFGASVEIEEGNEMYGYISGGSFSICKLSMYRATIIRLPGQSMRYCQYHIDC